MKLIFIVTLLVCVVCAETVMADGQGSSPRTAAAQVKEPESAASFDKRLPPVIPGEEVRDGNKKIKVWSTSGSLSVGDVPEPNSPNKQRDIDVGSVGVVVDQRDR